MTSCPAYLTNAADEWFEAKVVERLAYQRLTGSIGQAERAGVPEADIVRATGLARMTVRKYRRRPVEAP